MPELTNDFEENIACCAELAFVGCLPTKSTRSFQLAGEQKYQAI